MAAAATGATPVSRPPAGPQPPDTGIPQDEGPAAAPARGLTGWLADAIRAAIIDGRLQAGAPLPATRLLAGDLGVSRGVIVEAYQRLADEGLVSARPGPGHGSSGSPGGRRDPARAGRGPGPRRSGLTHAAAAALASAGGDRPVPRRA